MRNPTAVQVTAPVTTQVHAVIGTHGGSGASTVARMLDVESEGYAYELSLGGPLIQDVVPVLVARSTASGIQAAGTAVQHWPPGVPRPWLVIVADSPVRLPKRVRYRARVLSSSTHTLGVVHVPYLYALREVDNPAEGLTHRPVAEAARKLRAALGPSSS